MRLALRPYVTAGVAIVGASVIAVTPVTPTPTPRQAQSHAVQLSAAVQPLDAPSPFAALPSASALPQAAVGAGLMAGTSFENPITRWMEVFQATGVSLTKLYTEWAKDPFPLMQQIIANQTGYANLIGTSVTAAATGLGKWFTSDTGASLPESLPLIIQYIAQGDFLKANSQFGAALTAFMAPLFPLLNLISIPYQMSANFTAVIKTAVSKSMFDTGILAKTALGIIGLPQTALLSLATSAQAVVDASRAGDPLAALSAIVNAPAELVDTFLNGTVNRFGKRVGGLLAVANTLVSWGPVAGLLIYIPRLIAAAITPPAPPAPPAAATTELAADVNDVAALPSADAQTISLGSTPDGDAPVPTPAEETSGEAAETAPGTETDTVTEEEAPETETPVTDETEGTDVVDGTDETEGSEESDETTGSDDSEVSNGTKPKPSPNGSTDLSGGNKAEPGKTGSETNAGTGSGSGSGSAATDESTSPTTGTNTGTGSSTNDSGNDAGGSNDGSDGGSDS